MQTTVQIYSVHVVVYVFVNMCVWVCACVCMCVWVCACVCVCVCVCVLLCVGAGGVFVCVYGLNFHINVLVVLLDPRRKVY